MCGALISLKEEGFDTYFNLLEAGNPAPELGKENPHDNMRWILVARGLPLFVKLVGCGRLCVFW